MADLSAVRVGTTNDWIAVKMPTPHTPTLQPILCPLCKSSISGARFIAAQNGRQVQG
jgi:hypothetical protein